jgi:hypothetical protein
LEREHGTDCIRLTVTLAGERVEVEIFDDDHIEVSRFGADESIEGGMELLCELVKREKEADWGHLTRSATEFLASPEAQERALTDFLNDTERQLLALILSERRSMVAAPASRSRAPALSPPATARERAQRASICKFCEIAVSPAPGRR